MQGCPRSEVILVPSLVQSRAGWTDSERAWKRLAGLSWGSRLWLLDGRTDLHLGGPCPQEALAKGWDGLLGASESF